MTRSKAIDEVFRAADKVFEAADKIFATIDESEPDKVPSGLKTIRLKGNRFKNFWALLVTALKVLFCGTAKMRVRL